MLFIICDDISAIITLLLITNIQKFISLTIVHFAGIEHRNHCSWFVF
jgi:hypothetical protein